MDIYFYGVLEDSRAIVHEWKCWKWGRAAVRN
jgi:hypothetical protein